MIFSDKTSFLLPSLPQRPATSSVVPLRKFTPARLKVAGRDKENHNKVNKIKLDPKLLTQLSVTPKSTVPKTALASRPVNVDLKKTPDAKGDQQFAKMLHVSNGFCFVFDGRVGTYFRWKQVRINCQILCLLRDDRFSW